MRCYRQKSWLFWLYHPEVVNPPRFCGVSSIKVSWDFWGTHRSGKERATHYTVERRVLPRGENLEKNEQFTVVTVVLTGDVLWLGAHSLFKSSACMVCNTFRAQLKQSTRSRECCICIGCETKVRVIRILVIF